LRRLASDIQMRDQQLKNEGKKGIRAIGILGSDVYDKLMILRVLRKRFPKAIFFTTDLDASLLHPSEFQWTRNMLVASSFDLKIADHQELQRMRAGEGSASNMAEILINATKATIPQFRDVYQTSVYLSTLWASNKDLTRKSEKNRGAFDRSLDAATVKEAVRGAKETIEKVANEAGIDGNVVQAVKETIEKVANEAGVDGKIVQAAKEAIEKVANKTSIQAAKEALDKAANNVVQAKKEAIEKGAQEAEGSVVNEVVQFAKGVLQTVKDPAAKKVKEYAEETIKQAAILNAVQVVAIEQAKKLNENRFLLFKELFKGNLSPKVYEIGRNGPVELTEKPGLTLKEMLSVKDIANIRPFYPTKPSAISSQSILIVAACLMVFALLAFAFWCRWIVTSDLGGMGNGLYIRELNRARLMAISAVVMGGLQFFLEQSLIATVAVAFFEYILLVGFYCLWIQNIMEAKVLVRAAVTKVKAQKADEDARNAKKAAKRAKADAKAMKQVAKKSKTAEEAKLQIEVAQKVAADAIVVAEEMSDLAKQAGKKSKAAAKAKAELKEKYSGDLPKRLQMVLKPYQEEGGA